MEELIKVTTTEKGNQVVSARELYDFLGFERSQWARWAKKNIDNNPFCIENKDWMGFDSMSNGNKVRDYVIILDFAKRLSMLARTEKGEEVRTYFIECEKRLKSVISLPDFNNPAIAARAWADQFERAQAAEKTIEETRPMKELAESVLSSNDTVTVGEFAKALGAGPNKLFQWMRDEKLLIAHGAKYNLPFQKYLDAGYFDVVEKKRPNSDKLDFQTMITTKGQLYLTSRYMRS